MCVWVFFFFSSRRRHTRCALVTGVQTCALPISSGTGQKCRRHAGPGFSWSWHVARQAPRRIACHAQGALWHHAEPYAACGQHGPRHDAPHRSEEHTSELQSLMRISYAVFCLKKKKNLTLPESTQHALNNQ